MNSILTHFDYRPRSNERNEEAYWLKLTIYYNLTAYVEIIQTLLAEITTMR